MAAYLRGIWQTTGTGTGTGTGVVVEVVVEVVDLIDDDQLGPQVRRSAGPQVGEQVTGLPGHFDRESRVR